MFRGNIVAGPLSTRRRDDINERMEPIITISINVLYMGHVVKQDRHTAPG
jgi:hypothetical protein